MARLYIAINGDDVGSKIGDAVASNDHMALNKISTSLKDSHSMIEDWVTSHGGETITSSGDEGIFVISEEALQELDQIRDQYAQMSGHTLTVGVGNSMADASKALIYGKINDKNQVVHYEPAIDDILSEDQIDEAESTEEESGAVDQGEVQPGSEGGAEIPETQQKQYLNEDQMDSVQKPKVPLDTGDTVDYEDKDDSIESPDNEVGESNPYDSESDIDDTDEYENDVDEMVSNVADQEGDVENETEIDDVGGEELDDEEYMDPSEESEHDAIEGQMDDMDEDNIEHDAEMGNEDEDELVDMVHQDMQEEDEGYGIKEGDGMAQDNAPIEDDGMVQDNVPPDDHADMKGAIVETLQIFRDHKQDLDQLATANPNLHEGLISMLQHMIEMGKRLQETGTPQDIDETQELNEFSDEFPDAEGMEDEHEDYEQDQDVAEEEMDEHNEDMHGEDPDEDSAIEDDPDPERDNTPDFEDEGEDEKEDGDEKKSEKKPKGKL